MFLGATRLSLRITRKYSSSREYSGFSRAICPCSNHSTNSRPIRFLLWSKQRKSGGSPPRRKLFNGRPAKLGQALRKASKLSRSARSLRRSCVDFFLLAIPQIINPHPKQSAGLLFECSAKQNSLLQWPECG